MKIETGKLLYAKCDCMDNFRKGQMVEVNEIDSHDNILIDDVVWLERAIVEEYFTNKPIDVNSIDNSKEKFDSLKEAAKPLVDFLNENYDPMTIAIVKTDKVEIFSGEMGMPLKHNF